MAYKNKGQAREYNKKWRELHPEYEKNRKGRRKEQRAKYRRENKKKLAEKSKEWYTINKERAHEQRKRNREKNKEKLAKWHKRWRQANVEKCKEKEKIYYKNNKNKINKRCKIYYEKRKETILFMKSHLKKHYNITKNDFLSLQDYNLFCETYLYNLKLKRAIAAKKVKK